MKERSGYCALRGTPYEKHKDKDNEDTLFNLTRLHRHNLHHHSLRASDHRCSLYASLDICS